MNYQEYATAITNELRSWVHAWLEGVYASWTLHVALGLPLPHPNYPFPASTFPFGDGFTAWKVFEWVHEYGGANQLRHSYAVVFVFRGRTNGPGSSVVWKIQSGDIDLALFEIAGPIYDDPGLPFVLGAHIVVEALLESLVLRCPVRLGSHVVQMNDDVAGASAVQFFELRTSEQNLLGNCGSLFLHILETLGCDGQWHPWRSQTSVQASAGDVDAVRARVLAAAGSFDDNDYDPDLQDFLSPAPPQFESAPSSQPGEKGKGKAEAAPPPPSPPPPPPVHTNGAPTAPSTPVASGSTHPSPPVASGSGSVHPFCKAARLNPELVRASNKHGMNSSNAASAIDDLSSRLNATLENTAADQVVRISELEGTVAAHASTTARLAARRVASALAPHVANVKALRYVNENGKHLREDEIDDAIRTARLRAEQPGLVVDPAPVVYAAPAAASLLRMRWPSYMPLPPPLRHSPGTLPPPLPFPGTPLQRRPPSPPPPPPLVNPPMLPARCSSAPSRGNGKTTVKVDVSNLIREIIPTAPARINFRTRCSNPHPASYTLCTFETSAIADWVVASWASMNHGPYSSITTKSMLPKI
ncbi:hypothetical protein C8R44DRAFT_942995 [Mycena epipterygia]|nr:hypothetical protein C8R44DRAFT_942995 [Mycena epipterygia]